MDPYTVLRIEPAASAAEIRRAYRAAVLRWHPDRADGDAARFRAAATAHEILRDSDRRAAYDASMLSRPVFSPQSLDLGNVAVGFRTTRTVVVRNAGAGEPELGLDREHGTGWRVLSVAGSTAPGDGVEIEVEVDTAGLAAGRIHEALVVSLGARSARLGIMFTVADAQPVAGTWRSATRATGPMPAMTAAAQRAIPGWASVMGQPRWRLVAAAVAAGAVLPLMLLSGLHSSSSGVAVLAALGLISATVIVAIRTEGFEPTRLAAVGTGDQVGVAALSGIGAATAALFAIAIAIALIVAVLVIGALIAAMSDG